jgi:PKD repeat protein
VAISVPARVRALTSFLTASVVLAAGLSFVAPAYADTAPLAGVPETVASDVLPTVQINKSGIVWTQKIVGNTVYVGGSFTSARPAGVGEGGAGQVARANLLAYDIRTGVLNTSFAPTTNGEIKTIEVSPDKTRLYIGGNFTQVNGVVRNRIAAVNIADGSLITTFKPSVNKIVDAIGVHGSTVYLAGDFTAIGSSARLRGGAVSATNGALLPFAPAMDRRARAMVVSPDGSKVVFGGHFTTLNSQGGPNVGDDAGYGLGAVDSVTGQNLAWSVAKRVKNAGADAAIWSLSSDSDSLYGTGYHFGGGGNLEGTFRADWSTGDLIWVEDCHGDTYSAAQGNGVVYIAGHPHYCGTSGGYPQTEPWTVQRGLAWSKAPSSNVANGNTLGYPSWEGTTIPSLLTWYPDFYTGPSGQAAWSVAANDQYVVYGGDFPGVNQRAQMGLVRFAVKSIAPNKDAPRLAGADWTPTVSSYAKGTARIGWLANYDRDNELLTYELRRDGQLIYTTSAGSKAWWQRPHLGYLDTGLDAGSTHTYQVKAIDPYLNSKLSAAVSVTISATGEVSDYAQAVLDDHANTFWRLGDPSGSTSVVDWAGFNDGTAGSGVGFGQSGAINGDSNAAATFSGDGTGLVASTTPIDGPQTFALESWFNTTSTTGGKIVGFGNSNTGNSSAYDRHIYMDGSGTVYFGVYPGFTATVQSKAGLNDGQWHQAVAMMDASGMQLYIDGARVDRRSDVTSAQGYSGYWRVGGDSAWNGDNYFDGKIDDVSIYDGALTRDQVREHYTLSGRTLAGAVVPTDAYGSTVYAAQPDLYYRLGETSGTTAVDSSGNGNDGTYANGVTHGAAGAVVGTTDTAGSFDGNDDTVYTNRRFSNPTTYSLEGWFKTDSTSGGKLIGFGGNQTGNSGSHDRDVFLRADGTIVFGTWTGGTNLATTAPGYNDNKWHYVVATQSSAGMKLYVDGSLAGQNGQTGAENSVNYWRIGGDTTWESWFYLRGSIDEIAVYGYALSASDVLSHYNAGSSGTPANVAPTAAFTSTSTGLTLSVDGSGSTDSDGTVSSYAWNFGDGGTATGSTAEHTYTTAGDHIVTLTVTDDDGASDSVTHTVTVAAANAPPVAAFSSSSADLVATMDASGSSDSDGTVASYSWNFGDSTSGTGAKTEHTYAAAGTYDVILTVTDDKGATDSVTHPVTVTAAPPATGDLARDAFDRTLSAGLGNADLGGAWTATGSATRYSVNGTGNVTSVAGSTLTATLGSASSTDTEVQVTASMTQAATGGNHYIAVIGRRVGVNDYRVRLAIGTTGAVTMQLQRNGTTLTSGVVAGLTMAPADKVRIRLQVTGTSPTTIQAKVWKVGGTEPAAWRLTTTDSTDGYQSAGGVGIATYLNGAATASVTTRFDDFWAGPTASAPPAPTNAAPTAAFSFTTTDLAASFNGSASSDVDGTVDGYAWTFGDGGVGTGATPNHDYGSAGTYSVKLTVTDNKGATDSITKSVTVAAPVTPPAGPLATDDFGRAVTGGWGTATTGGTWTLKAGGSYFSVDGAGKITTPAAGKTIEAYLNGVSSTATEVKVSVGFGPLPVGGNVYAAVVGRRTATEDYRVRVTLTPAGQVQLALYRTGAAALKTVTLSNLTMAADERLQVRFQVTGSGATTLNAKAWKVGATEPAAWQATATDSTSSLQVAGGVGLGAYFGGGVTSLPSVVSFDDLLVTEVK